MKKIIQNHAIAVILIMLLSFFACNKEDNTTPIITLTGDTLVKIALNSPYVDAGATATDDKDGDITKSIFVKNEVDINRVGTYLVLYSVSDKAGNATPTISRKVKVYNNSDKYKGNYTAKNYTYYPIIDSTSYNTTLIIDSTLNNRLVFTIFGDNIPKHVYFNVNSNQVEFPYQTITYPNDSTHYTFQGYGSINDSVISINYFKVINDTVSSCKAKFEKQK
jgi:hypothetical protein